MVKIIVGPKGTGKTKTLIDMVNNSVEKEKGDVVCIEKGEKLTYDINHKARLISMSQFMISDFSAFIGFICGIVASDYDISVIYIDSIFKIAGDSMDDLAQFLEYMDLFTEKNNFKMILTASADKENIPERIHKYFM